MYINRDENTSQGRVAWIFKMYVNGEENTSQGRVNWTINCVVGDQATALYSNTSDRSTIYTRKIEECWFWKCVAVYTVCFKRNVSEDVNEERGNVRMLEVPWNRWQTIVWCVEQQHVRENTQESLIVCTGEVFRECATMYFNLEQRVLDFLRLSFWDYLATTQPGSESARLFLVVLPEKQNLSHGTHRFRWVESLHRGGDQGNRCANASKSFQ